MWEKTEFESILQDAIDRQNKLSIEDVEALLGNLVSVDKFIQENLGKHIKPNLDLDEEW